MAQTTTSSGIDSSANGDKSAGRLMKEVTEDLSTLVRKEVELAKQELSSSIGAKVKGAVIFALAGFLAFFVLIFLLLAVRDAFDNLWATWLADLATAGVLIIVSVVAIFVGKKKLATPISTELTKKSIKEDVEWAKTLNKR
ncbi:MAG: hypothetical protein QOH26_2010 [Actinomycetota bacterium]|jgi:uncharacterized membrane protein YqjE|nr:hypothetical protein [Actinomycetota bacterium]